MFNFSSNTSHFSFCRSNLPDTVAGQLSKFRISFWYVSVLIFFFEKRWFRYENDDEKSKTNDCFLKFDF